MVDWGKLLETTGTVLRGVSDAAIINNFYGATPTGWNGTSYPVTVTFNAAATYGHGSIIYEFAVQVQDECLATFTLGV